ncbi:MAG: endolytic transglycosylase MltG [Bacteroidales bacterium]
MTTTKKKTFFRIVGGLLILLFFLGSVSLYMFYHHVYEPNVDLKGQTDQDIYIPTGSTYEDVRAILHEQDLLLNPETFHRLALRKNYHNRVRPGRYVVHDNMSNNGLINMLRAGNQVPVKVTFNNIRTSAQLAGMVSRILEVDSLSVINLLKDPAQAKAYGFGPETFPLMFIPNTYEFYWNTSASALFDRMHQEYKRYWNNTRLEKARSVNLTPSQAAILASIIQLETNKKDEMATIAGVYINRLQKNIPLQADPTVVFAVGDLTIKRVLNHHLKIDSPYNTYLNAGLPPGPISLPAPDVVDEVLNYEDHDYIFFCARDDFSGYHAFAKTYSEHLANARRYQKALNERKIMK